MAVQAIEKTENVTGTSLESRAGVVQYLLENTRYWGSRGYYICEASRLILRDSPFQLTRGTGLWLEIENKPGIWNTIRPWAQTSVAIRRAIDRHFSDLAKVTAKGVASS